jgi:hypothetical protein
LVPVAHVFDELNVVLATDDEFDLARAELSLLTHFLDLVVE